MSNVFVPGYTYECHTEDSCEITDDLSKAEESDAIVYHFFNQCWDEGEPNTVRTRPKKYFLNIMATGSLYCFILLY